MLFFGHTWSYAPKASRSNFKVYITDHQGRIQDEDFDYPVGGEGDAIGYGVVESAASENIILVGNTAKAGKKASVTTFLTSLQYYQFDLSEFGIGGETFGNASDKKLELSPAFFIDRDNNSFIEEGERGYVEIEVSNPGGTAKTNVVAEVSSSEGPELNFWENLYLGTIGAGQTRKLRIPVVATSKPRSSNYRLDLNLKVNKKHVATTKADIASNTPNPANLVYNRSHFTPAVNPLPGEPIELQIELNNLGGAPTESVAAEFLLPPGVTSEGSEKIMLPSIAPRASHNVSFVFTYSEEFIDRDLQLTFDVASTDEMVGLKKSFTLALPDNKPIVEVSKPDKDPASEIIWVSHDTEEFRTIDVNTKQVDLEVIALSNQAMSKRNFAVLINGRRSQGQKLDESRLSRPKNNSASRVQHKYENTVSLAEGLNEVQIVYYSEDGKNVVGTSAPITFHYIPKDKPNLYVLSIGVKHNDLKYTENDAKAVAQMYEQLGGKSGFKKVYIADMVESSETTERSIKKAFLDLERRKSIKDNDLVVVFISSHGKVVDGDRYVLLPSDYDPQYDEIGTIDFNEDVLKRLRNVDGNKLVFIDACHSGSAGSRSFSNEAASKVMNDLINATAGLEIFASCGDREFSYEDDRWEHGAFTKAILEAFKDETVEIDGKRIHSDIYKEVDGVKKAGSDGVITIEELKLFVQQRVPQLVKDVKMKPQNPTNKSTELLPKDMGIFMVNK